jgi:N-acetylglucosaminyl-diphospho-decaprenol L-rhamnosyltransferase
VTAVSVVVPVHGGFDIAVPCLESVPDDVELLVVDDRSPDDTADRIEEAFPRARVLRNDVNLGFGATANRGLAAATGDVRVVLNSDARLRAGALDRLVAGFRDPAVGIAGPRLVFPDGSHQLSAAAFPTVGSFVAGSHAVNEVYRRLRPGRRFRWELGLTKADHDRSQDVDWVQGACIAIRAACFEATGGFDPAYRMYVEECDLCWRAHQAGWRVRYVADAEVVHIGGASGGGDPARQARYNLDGEARFMARAYGEQVLRRWRVARLVSSTVKVAVLALPALVDRRLRDRVRWHRAAVAHLLATSR